MPSLAEWVRALRERPYAARIFGPPNALVTEKAGGKKEKMAEAAEKLRKEYGLDEPVPLREKGPHPAEHVEGECKYCTPKDVPPSAVSHQNVPPLSSICVRCGEKPKEGRTPLCSGCRKAAYRERKS